VSFDPERKKERLLKNGLAFLLKKAQEMRGFGFFWSLCRISSSASEYLRLSLRLRIRSGNFSRSMIGPLEETEEILMKSEELCKQTVSDLFGE
jgi:hypothetical protein